VVRHRRPSPQTVGLVSSFARNPRAWRYGYELCQELGIKPGSMYPILMRLADGGLLETAWETDARPGRPPRHLYRLTGTGVEYAADVVAAASRPATAARSAPRLGDVVSSSDGRGRLGVELAVIAVVVTVAAVAVMYAVASPGFDHAVEDRAASARGNFLVSQPCCRRWGRPPFGWCGCGGGTAPAWTPNATERPDCSP
jgi:hypothetical protein